MNKKQLRASIREAKKQLSPSVLQAAAHSFATQAHSLVSSAGADTVLLYASLSDEVPTSEFLLATPARCILPCVADDTHLDLRLYTGPHDLEVRGPYHIPEPTGLLVPLSELERAVAAKPGSVIAFIPGMAFDGDGHRLGRGKGYYDRLLSAPVFRNIRKIGVCFDFQLIAHVPCEPHDLPMDELLVIPTDNASPAQ